MNRAEHIATAEHLLQSAADAGPSEYAAYAVAVAQVYATLDARLRCLGCAGRPSQPAGVPLGIWRCRVTPRTSCRASSLLAAGVGLTAAATGSVVLLEVAVFYLAMSAVEGLRAFWLPVPPVRGVRHVSPAPSWAPPAHSRGRGWTDGNEAQR